MANSTVALQPPGSAALPDNMVSFSFRHPLRMIRCATDHQLLTPPASPDTPITTIYTEPRELNANQDGYGIGRTVTSNSVAQTRLQRFFLRFPRSPTGAAHSGQSRHSKASSSSSTSSPMPSQPFQSSMIQSEHPSGVGLATSPAIDEISTLSDDETHDPPLDLRRVSSRFDNIRAAAAQQQPLDLRVPSHPHSPLLPSPIINDHRMKIECHTTSFIENKLAQDLNSKHNGGTYKSYDDLRILSCYDDGSSFAWPDNKSDESHTQSTSGGELERSPPSSCDTSPISETSPKSFSELKRESTESDWLANTTSHDERIRRFRARCYQVVQHPYRGPVPSNDQEDKIMLATVLVGPGKPKLVEIQKSHSSATSMKSNRSFRLSEAMAVSKSICSAPPSTPTSIKQEVSAFSPYDTPSNFTPFTDLSNSSSCASQLTLSRPTCSESTVSLVPQPLTFSRNNCREIDVNASCSRQPRSSAYQAREIPALTFLEQSSQRNPSRGVGGPVTLGKFRTLPTRQPSTREIACPDSCLLSMIVGVVTTAVELFPTQTVRLESAAIRRIADYIGARNDERIMRSLSTVFPSAPKYLISTLAAWVIIDLYFSKVDAEPLRCQCSQISEIGQRNPQRMPSSPPSAWPGQHKQRSAPRHGSGCLSGRDPLPASISNDSLRCIPHKARQMLGIGHVVSERHVPNRIQSLQASITIVAQKLFESLRARDVWDLELWRALSVIVEAAGSTPTSASCLDVTNGKPNPGQWVEHAASVNSVQSRRLPEFTEPRIKSTSDVEKMLDLDTSHAVVAPAPAPAPPVAGPVVHGWF